MNLEQLKKELQELALHDPILNEHLTMAEISNQSVEQTLIGMVKHLAGMKKAYQDELIKLHMNSKT